MPTSNQTFFTAWAIRHAKVERTRDRQRWLYSALIAGAAGCAIGIGSLLVFDHLPQTKGDASKALQTVQVSLASPPAPPELLDPGPLTQPSLSRPEPIVPPQMSAPLTELKNPPLVVPRPLKLQKHSQKKSPVKTKITKKTEAPPAEKATAPPASENMTARKDIRQAEASSGAYDNWMGRVHARLAAFRTYPRETRAEGIEGRVEIWFRFDRQGRVVGSGLVKSCGNESLDEAAIAVPKNAEPIPLPPNPDELSFPYTVTIRINYSLDY